jgi:predicted Fe-Mo cluster-binding NifX family protein
MKIAICSKDNTISSEVESRFGRCSFFGLYDSIDHSITFIGNTAESLAEGAGPAALELLKDRGVEKIISGNFGYKLKALASDASIQLIVLKEKHTIKDIIQLLHH